MSSTRNINNKTNYNVKEKQHNKIFVHNTYLGKGNNNNTTFFELGTNPAFKRDQMTNNSIDVESMLRGIRSTNLEGDSFSVVAENKNINVKPLFEKPRFVMPSPFEHSTIERPLYLF